MASSTLKNRIVGTLVVVAIAVIFLPDFFSGNSEGSEQEFRSTPARPDVEQRMSSTSFPDEFSVEDQSSRDTVSVPIVEDQIEIRELPASVDLGEVDSSATEDPANQTTNTDIEAPEANNDSNSEPSENVTSEADEVDVQAEAAWVIQLGAFQNQDTVVSLLAELEDAGYNAYSRVYQRDAGPLHLVLVGPDMSKEALEQQLAPLQELTNLEGKVMPYRPADN
ncbi:MULTISPECIES: SPOR domain-containing protein [Gammaproteobacteria]|uniref:SPOR domain-containing protein n=1 Tax=Gammaproteobacteria TaxID=1236 RepID=UPI000DCF7597|nr:MULTISPECIES: SPOR domain-containing protein [Gammaproteobacteria]RTE86866.1 hypothetical protein DQX04_00280 [Aliidiomarina sp. B3213]TCZ93345.1 hypothetical protein EYQ95_05020 [Lysobacter sp. N42]